MLGNSAKKYIQRTHIFARKNDVKELKKLCIQSLSWNTVKNVLKEHGIDPLGKRGGDTWNNFLNRHFQTLWACDFFTKTAITSLGPKVSFVLFFINIKTRKVHITGLTPYPNQELVNKQTQLLLPSLKYWHSLKESGQPPLTFPPIQSP